MLSAYSPDAIESYARIRSETVVLIKISLVAKIGFGPAIDVRNAKNEQTPRCSPLFKRLSPPMRLLGVGFFRKICERALDRRPPFSAKPQPTPL